MRLFDSVRLAILISSNLFIFNIPQVAMMAANSCHRWKFMIIIGTSGRSANLYRGADLAMHQRHPFIHASCTAMRDSTDTFFVCVCVYV